MTTEAVRLPDVEPGSFPEGFDWGVMSYWRQGSVWMLHLPPNSMGNLSDHEVTEHEDGTITVSPSILVTRPGDESVLRHGHLKRGVWHPCGDDRP